MSDNNDLFSGSKSSALHSPVKLWRMVTNQRNLYFMIAAGMILPEEGFGQKYYEDTLSAYPGYLPIFPNHVPANAVKLSISEKNHLIPCIVDLDLSTLHGPVKVITQEGEIKNASFPGEVDDSCQLILIRAPLPMSFAKSFVFRSREEKLNFEKDTADFGNVDYSDYKLKIATKEFTKAENQVWPPQDITLDPITTPLALPMAAGAMMGVLMNMGKSGDLSISAGRVAFDPAMGSAGLVDYPVIEAMGQWFEKNGLIEASDVSQNLFWDVVSKVAKTKFSTQMAGPVDVAIDYLEALPSNRFNEKARSYGQKLGSDLRGVLRLADSTLSEIFDSHPKPVSRAMALFVLREKIEDLLEFKHEKLTEADYILAAILFSARDGWMALSKDLRNLPDMNRAVCHRMAAFSQRISDSNLSLGEAPARPQSLFELLSPGKFSMSKRQNEAALFVARAMKWDCIQTRIVLGKGDYQLGVTTAGIELKLDGDVMVVVAEVLKDEFMAKLRTTEIPAKIDHKIRDIMLGAK